nr:hypothetical protein CFP56_72104 [Quercus suber]
MELGFLVECLVDPVRDHAWLKLAREKGPMQRYVGFTNGDLVLDTSRHDDVCWLVSALSSANLHAELGRRLRVAVSGNRKIDRQGNSVDLYLFVI